MFALPYHPYAPPCHSHNPYERLLLEQEMQRRRQVEAYRRQQLKVEELNRRWQYEHALRQAELDRQRQMQIAMERERYQSMAEGGMEELLGMLYGSRVKSTPSYDRHSCTPERKVSTEGLDEQENADRLAESASNNTSQGASPTGPVERSDSASTISAAELEAVNTESEAAAANTSGSHAAVTSVLSMFASLQSEFRFPSQLDFLPSSSSDSVKLAYTPNNAPLHQYEHALTGLLTRLDAVESYGDKEVRKGRKEAVKGIEKELEGLDKQKVVEWKRQNTHEMEQSIEEAEVNGEDRAAVMEAVAAVVPLPEELEDEREEDECEADEAGEAGEAETKPSDDGPSTATQSSDSSSFSPLSNTQAKKTPLEEASSSEESDSEVEEYVDVGVDTTSNTKAEEIEEIEGAEVESEKELVWMDEWETKF